MNREYHHWVSAALGRSMETLVFGHAGAPVLVFPTTMGRFYQYEDFGMVAALAAKIDAGLLQLFCPDSVDAESWYNRAVPPRQRVLRHLDYERYILTEYLPFIRRRNPGPLLVTGTSFGAYHAANLTFRHPHLVTKLVALSGRYDIKGFLDGYYDDDVYFNCPVDYLPNLADETYLAPLRRMEIVLVTGEHDLARQSTQYVADVLTAKGVPVRCVVWWDYTHDWPLWREAIPHYL
ncbi:MAG: esterase [Armatimonadota bacterium]|nr:esterase [Armatimonadota bacterium]MDR7484785.1 esterase [Armatimonadota bacterium]MDR7531900.1 esterase [Armatimonadota bacterium]MDR7534755.1 esterase [Armatimonadota bacterium]